MSGASWLLVILTLAVVILVIALLRKRARNKRDLGSGELDVTELEWEASRTTESSTWRYPIPEGTPNSPLGRIENEPVRNQSTSREDIQPASRRRDDDDYYEPRRRHISDGYIPVVITDHSYEPRHDQTRHDSPDTHIESPASNHSGHTSSGWGGNHGNDGGSHGGGGGSDSSGSSSSGGDSGGGGGGGGD